MLLASSAPVLALGRRVGLRACRSGLHAMRVLTPASRAFSRLAGPCRLRILGLCLVAIVAVASCTTQGARSVLSLMGVACPSLAAIPDGIGGIAAMVCEGIADGVTADLPPVVAAAPATSTSSPPARVAAAGGASSASPASSTGPAPASPASSAPSSAAQPCPQRDELTLYDSTHKAVGWSCSKAAHVRIAGVVSLHTLPAIALDAGAVDAGPG